MTGRFAVDFGTSNTVIASWDETRQESDSINLEGLSKEFDQGSGTVWMIPSLIHYGDNANYWIGNQVQEKKAYHSKRTFRWMKRYISNRSPMRVRVDDQDITPFKAGEDFLKTILSILNQSYRIDDEEIAFSVPVEAYEHYENWITTTAEKAGIRRVRLIDEPTAAAIGYGSHIQTGQVSLIFDFGGGTLHTAIVINENQSNGPHQKQCRILGKAGKAIGGASIDQWLYQETLRKNDLSESDEDVRQLSNSLLIACEQVKEKLSFNDSVNYTVTYPENKRILNVNFTRSEYEELLDQHNLFLDINNTIRKAINLSRERGYDEEMIQSVYMVGGCSQIPAVQRTIRQSFGKEIVFMDRPLDAIARGSAAFVAGIDFYDHIQHDYGIRYIDPEKQGYQYHIIVKRGTPYPSHEPITHITVKASFEGQKQLGIAIYEIGEKRKANQQEMQIVFDTFGSARIIPVSQQEEEQMSLYWMNENNPTFLDVDPPAKKGEPYFDVDFKIDRNKRLIITVRDLTTNNTIYSDLPVIKLS